ncbi:unnamed protein product, partial [Didymodactylos carnosus]
MHPRTKNWHTLDYTLINKKFRSAVEDVRFYRKAASGIGTDHHLMRSKIKLHLKSREKCASPQILKVDRVKLTDDKVLDQFRNDIAKNHKSLSNSHSNINERYANFVQGVMESALKNLAIDKRVCGKRKEWLTEEILNSAEKKALAFISWQNHRGSSEEKKYRNEYVVLRKLMKKQVDQRQVEYWDQLSEEIEAAINQHDPATAYGMIRRLKGGKQSVENMPIADKNGNLLVNSKDRLGRWREYFSELLNVHTIVDSQTIDQIPVFEISSAEQKRQDEPPTLVELDRALQQMKNRKAPGNDDISADILKAGGVPLLKWLHEIFLDIWNSEVMVDDWTSAILIRLFKNKGDKKVCDNYRGISLLVVASKLFTRVILN